jgi:hypothetical protein
MRLELNAEAMNEDDKTKADSLLTRRELARRRKVSVETLVAKGSTMLKVQAVLHDGSVALEFMTDDNVESEEMRVQFLDFDRAGEVRVLDEPGWFAV